MIWWHNTVSVDRAPTWTHQHLFIHNRKHLCTHKHLLPVQLTPHPPNSTPSCINSTPSAACETTAPNFCIHRGTLSYLVTLLYTCTCHCVQRTTCSGQTGWKHRDRGERGLWWISSLSDTWSSHHWLKSKLPKENKSLWGDLWFHCISSQKQKEKANEDLGVLEHGNRISDSYSVYNAMKEIFLQGETYQTVYSTGVGCLYQASTTTARIGAS